MTAKETAPKSAAGDLSTRLAAERTLLAWIRTSLAMMGFGFVIARFGLFLREIAQAQHAAANHTSTLSLILGMAMVSLGVVVNLTAAYQHFGLLRRLEAGEPERPPRWSLAVITSVSLAALGAGIAGYLFFRR
ncbi:MAG: DUF202 domain-containing protein [Chloroflexi bacterium]|nr:DUF202 domain-containing protein [Chloroflexota bacterium]